ncbi:MAG: hypothetical protein V1899_10485 [Planctomycetota bacterium]
MNAWTIILPIILGGIATLAIYSFLVKENPFYRFFEHLYIGIATGFGIVFGIQRFLWPELFRPMLGYDREILANGVFDRPWRMWYFFYLLPFALGTLYYFIYSRKRQWLSRVVIAWSLGVAGGFALKGFFAQYMPQIIGSFKPLIAVQTVERNLLIRFDGIADRLPQNAQIIKGRIELYRLGPSYTRVVYKDNGGQLVQIEGLVVYQNNDQKNGSVTLTINDKEQIVQNSDIVQREDIAPPQSVPDAYEGYGGEHTYLAYRLLCGWDANHVDWERRRQSPAARESLMTAMAIADPTERIKALEIALGTRLDGDVELISKIDPMNTAQVAETAATLVSWRPEDFSPTAESNTGMPLLIRRNVTINDPYRGEKWVVGNRESVGVKTEELALDTLRSWFTRPETNFGVILQRKSGAGGSFLHRFASVENPDISRRPRLVIEYRVLGDDQLKELILQNGVDNYIGTVNAIRISDVNTPAAVGQEFLLGASARKPSGALSLDVWSYSGILANWIFALTLICVMTYFLFSFEHSRAGIYQASLAGRWMMMLCFGAFFGSTIMARMALLVERMQFLIEKWIPTILGGG